MQTFDVTITKPTRQTLVLTAADILSASDQITKRFAGCSEYKFNIHTRGNPILAKPFSRTNFVEHTDADGRTYGQMVKTNGLGAFFQNMRSLWHWND